jgi:hypothetical protein
MGCEQVRDDRLSVLYGEAEPEALRRVREHHDACRACREEFAALQALRRKLAAWKLPEPARNVGAPSRERRHLGLAAAAVFVLALGASLRIAGASLEVRGGPLSFSLGRSEGRPPLADEARREVAALRTELRAMEARLAAVGSGDTVVRQAEALLASSEDRQTRQLDDRLRRLEERIEAQRRYDIARVAAGLSYLDGKTGQHVARTTELMGYMLQASDRR